MPTIPERCGYSDSSDEASYSPQLAQRQPQSAFDDPAQAERCRAAAREPAPLAAPRAHRCSAAPLTHTAQAGDQRLTDTRADEQERGITIKSTGISLYYAMDVSGVE